MFKKKEFSSLLCLLLCLNIPTLAKGANILAITLMASPSHHIWNRALVLGLVERGHNVTMLSHDTEKKQTTNFTVIQIPGVYEYMQEKVDITNLRTDYFWYSTKILFDYFDMTSEYDVNYGKEQIQLILSSGKTHKYDLVIWDINTHQCLYPLVEKLGNPPVVGVSPYGYQPYMYAYENHVYPSYIPTSSLPYTSEMTFAERLYNSLSTWFLSLYRAYVYMPSQMERAIKMFGNDIKPLEETEEEISGMILVNNDPLLDYPQAYPPNIIPVGALQVKPGKPLEKDLQDIMDNAKDGVILFSLGTNIQSDTLGEKTINGLLKAFSKLKQTVLWKFPSELENLPKNVVLRKWLPQNDILAHPNTKLFISHGGGLSTHETIYHGIPAVEIPFLYDQIGNALRLTRAKMARTLDHRNIKSDVAYNEIMEVLTNPIYRENIQRLSKRFRDQPQTPLQRATFWIEYVLRHGDVKYLTLPSKKLRFYEVQSYDVILFLIVLFLIACSLSYKLSICCCRKVFQSKIKEKIS